MSRQLRFIPKKRIDFLSMIKQSKHNWRPHSCKDWENETYQFNKDESNISLFLSKNQLQVVEKIMI